MKFFDQLGAQVEQRWKEQNYDDAVFADVARTALETLPPARHIDYREILHWALNTDQLPPQDLRSQFGEPPLTVYKGDLFYIEALFWLTAQTEIHEHSFAGAFHVLEGSSLHSRYHFEPKHRINSRFLLGEVQLRHAELLTKGETRPIHPGNQFSHSIFHLEKPTVTIVVRTPVNEEARPQHAYLKPSLAIDAFSRREVSNRQLQLLDLLQRAGDWEYGPRALNLVARSDLEATFWILEHVHRNAGAEQFGQLLEAARWQHGEVAEGFPAILRAMRCSEKINSRCRFVEDAEHRLLLGLLHAFPNRAAIFKFLRTQYDDDPIELIARWVEEMAAPKAGDEALSNALGIRFDESSLLLFRYLLEGLSFEEIKARLGEEYDPEDVAAKEEGLRVLLAALRDSVLFEPLFAEGEAPAFEISGARWRPVTPAQQLLARAERATRGITFSCFVDAPPTDLISARTRRSQDATSATVVNPTLRCELQATPSNGERPQPAFLPAHPVMWIQHPGTEIETPLCIHNEHAALLADLLPGQTAPAALDEEMRARLALARILVPRDESETCGQRWERVCDKARAEFQSRGYTRIPDVLEPLPLSAMRRYYREVVASGRLLLGDGQVDKRYGLYNEPLARFFHGQLTSLMSRVAGEPVKPSYLYFAAYQPGAVLEPHLDRAQCEFSISFLVDYAPEPDDVSPWPLHMRNKTATDSTAMYQAIGDAVFYKGCEVIHYREALPENHLSTSIFFHFVPENFEGPLE